MKAGFDGEFNNDDATMLNRLRLHGLRPHQRCATAIRANRNALRHQQR